MKKRFLPIVLFVAILPLAAAGAVRGAENPLQAPSKSPIHITSDRLEAFDDKALVVFSGNVVATQDDAVIHGDDLYLYYDKKSEGEKSDGKNAPPGLTTSGGKIQRIELRGNVNVKKGERTATGDKAVFHNAEQTVVMTGNAVMREGDNVITGDKITVFLKENRGVVESSSREKRVTAVIYPKDDTSKRDTPKDNAPKDGVPKDVTPEDNKNDRSRDQAD
ncbi:MAG: lipopolysaccharide transport periplasmic protein LptA [Candidatus Altiarchaeota archaeon]|nr:lipopolysaccharide transport periplasmic protein LptA [Candidatus Altiarchaeota archaeon]